ncbi:MAG TPA: tetratricopeptide repeat protein [Paludibacteraceae bacterium]|nr:tetratricopeptide repeat protein [Paludibacteraceae bacterium]HOJ66656.1 tetratricopeptide repeat protein [Paludibacteraceae bacterium]HOL28677.1 tetratricopeptide repeat protein [Paludibacteraceae bacterium]HON01936.1 tetratricopeptide repeat protein [Paludibacteraceae bacterium]HPD59352.1 tetratricopeptide repeat protein [Paludibacteraceae bacterium]
MKKIILSFFLVLSFTFTYAQKSNVSKAKNKALMENPDFAGAREAIQAALNDSITKNDPNTWYVAGLIGYKENDYWYQKLILNQKYDADAKGQAILESYNYFKKAAELDQLPDAKGKVKPKFLKDIKTKIKEYYTLQPNLIGYGAYLYEKKDYEGALKVFETYLEIPTLPYLKDEIVIDSTYYMIQYFAALSATNAGYHDKAISLYEDLKHKNYETLNVYELLADEYRTINDTIKYVETLKEGLEKFPSELWFLQNLINHYIYSGKIQDALAYLNDAIKRDPNIAQYYFVKGNLEENLGNYDEAISAFNKAIELDPNLAEAYAGIGRLYYNKAIKMLEVANDIKDVKLFNQEKEKANKVFKESIPYFQKAKELNPNEIEYKRTLRTLYYRLQMDKEFEAIDEEIRAMENQ